MAPAPLLASLLAALQASLSVLLVICYGGGAAHFKLLDSPTASKISKLCVKMFLPALLFTKIGSQLHLESAHRYLIILIWAFACHLLSFLIGIAAHYGLGMPDWITAAIMFNNTTSYPLLLIQSLDDTGILKNLILTDEATSDAIERAKSYFLVFATISSCLTFSIGPRLIDSEHAPEPPSKEEEIDDEPEERDVDENTGLLGLPQNLAENWHRRSVSFFPSREREPSRTRQAVYDRRPSVIPKRKWLDLHPRTKWWLLLLSDFFNAPLLGAILGAIIGLVPALHRAFFFDTQDGGIFTAWLTASFKTIGQLFVPLPVVIAGVSLYTSIQASRHAAQGDGDEEPATPWLTTAFILVIRFVVWPAIAISTIYGLAKNTNILGDDPMLHFTLMLMPTGPPAMKLITMIQVSDADPKEEHKIAKLLTISYVISPILAFTVVGALRASQAALSA